MKVTKKARTRTPRISQAPLKPLTASPVTGMPPNLTESSSSPSLSGLKNQSPEGESLCFRDNTLPPRFKNRQRKIQPAPLARTKNARRSSSFVSRDEFDFMAAAGGKGSGALRTDNPSASEPASAYPAEANRPGIEPSFPRNQITEVKSPGAHLSQLPAANNQMPADAAGPADSQTNPAEFHSGRPAGISPLTSTGGTTAKLLTDPEHKNTRAKRKGKFGLSPSYETSLLLTQETGIKVDSELMPSLPVQDIQRSVTEREALMPYINDRLSEMSEPAAASRPNATSSDAESGSEIFSDFRAEPKKPSDKIKDNDAIIPSPETIPGPVQDTAGSSDPAAEEEPEIFQPSQPQRPTASVLTEGIMPPATDSLPGDSRPDITQTPASPTSDQVGLSPYLQLTQALFPNPQGLFAVSFPFEPGQPPALTETKAREPDFVSDCEPGGSDDSDTGFVSDRICFQAESEADWFAASSGFPGSQAAENPGDDEHYSHDGVSGLSYQKLTETKSSGEKNNQFDRNDFFTRPSETGESAEQRTSSEHQADVRLDATDRCPAEAGIKRPDLTADYGIQGKIHSRDDSGSDIVAMSRSWYEAQNNKLFKILSIMQWTSIFLVLLIIFQAVTRPEPRYYGVTTELKVVEMIPMKEPSFTPKNIGSWTADVVTRALSLDFLYLREKLTDVQNDFSEIGFESYVKSLEQNGHIKKIETEKLNLSCALTGPPVVTNTKGIGREKTWRVEMPVLVSYQTSQGVVANQSLVAEVTVQKADASKKPRGVEISQLVLLKRG